MPSTAYVDFVARMKEPSVLARNAMSTTDAVFAAALSKSAAVLAAAALERYVNEIIHEYCSKISATAWTGLTEGQKRYMSRQIARAVYAPARRIYRRADDGEARREKLRKIVARSASAFNDPSTWTHATAYGLFMDGAAEPARIQSTLKEFDPSARNLFDFVETRTRNRAAIARSLTSLIDARHAAAHAKPGTSAPGPADVRSWMGLGLVLVRQIEAYLGFRA